MNWKWWVKAPSPDQDISAEQMERAARAKSTLPIMYEAYAEVREALLDQIIKSGPADDAEREYFYHAVKALDALVAKVETYAEQGDMAEAMRTFNEKVRN